ncbi:MAG: YiiX/YebB-like N1pC/P60 family cysteine hydrolase [Dehalococcoidia bacterium]|nr:YiiX/YebB-like N1pC/P60 family cysteine hydrolase [Dehalococcoidia bacterium]
MRNRIAIMVGLIAAVVLLFTSASTVGAASEGKYSIKQLAKKDRLTGDDVACLRSLSREARREILSARGWKEIVIPDEYESYQDLVSVKEVANAYEEAIRAAGGRSAENELQSEGGRMKNLEEALMAMEKNCVEKENYLSFDRFKSEERWVPCAKDLQRNHDVIGRWGISPRDGNNCDFALSSNGDIILVKGSGFFPGVFCHAAIVKYRSSLSLFSIGPNGDNGVWWNSQSQLHQYSHASVQRVDTWPLSSNRRQTAADYAREQLGKPYNWIFVDKWRTDAFYCSQLCWAAYYHPSPWYYKLDLDAVPDAADFGAVAPDALWLSWRTGTVTCSD